MSMTLLWCGENCLELVSIWVFLCVARGVSECSDAAADQHAHVSTGPVAWTLMWSRFQLHVQRVQQRVTHSDHDPHVTWLMSFNTCLPVVHHLTHAADHVAQSTQTVHTALQFRIVHSHWIRIWFWCGKIYDVVMHDCIYIITHNTQNGNSYQLFRRSDSSCICHVRRGSTKRLPRGQHTNMHARSTQHNIQPGIITTWQYLSPGNNVTGIIMVACASDWSAHETKWGQPTRYTRISSLPRRHPLTQRILATQAQDSNVFSPESTGFFAESIVFSTDLYTCHTNKHCCLEGSRCIYAHAPTCQ